MQSSYRRTSDSGSQVVRDESFPKETRLLKRHEFIRVQRRGKKYETRSLLLIVLPGKKDLTRLGIAASRKIGNAVERSRLKRIIREAFRRNKRLFFVSSDVVVIPKRVEHRITYSMIVNEINSLSLKRGKRA